MTSDLAWIIRVCLFQVCLWRACLCNKSDCPYSEYLEEMIGHLPNDYLFRVNKSEETIERVEKSLSWFYGNNCKKDYECGNYTDGKTTAVCYLLGCLHKENQNPECVSSVTYCLAEVELVSLKGFMCLVKDAFNQKYNQSQKQDEECADVFVDAVRCQKATTLDTNPPTIYTTTLPTINYKTTSIPPKTSSSTTPPPSSLTSSTISNNDDMELQEQQLQNTNPPTIYTTTLPTINYKTTSIPPKTSSSTTTPPSSLTSSTISNNDDMELQEQRLQNTNPPTIYTTTLPTINYKTSSIPPKTSSSTTPPPSSLTSSTISNNDDMEFQEQLLQSKVISVSTLLAISLIANILLLGFVILRTWGRRQNEGVFPAMPELTLLNAVEVHHLMQNNNGDALQY